MFGTSTQQTQSTTQSGGLFGSLASSQLQPSALPVQQQQQQAQPSLSGNFQRPTQSNIGSFASFGQQQPTPQQQANFLVSQLGSSQLGTSTNYLPKLGQSTLWEYPQQGPRERSVSEQLGTVLEKWHPESPNCLFQYYFYNNVDPRAVPFYTPNAGEDERKWEEALSQKPSEGSIPVLGKGFMAVATRLSLQSRTVQALQVRLHEINNSLNLIMQKHDLEWSVKIAEAKRRHITLSQRALALATKVQVLRSRGYAMESNEEDLRRRLSELEAKAFDPILSGKQEEVWARLSTLRQQAQWLQDESEKVGNEVLDRDNVVDAGKLKQIEQILRDYKSQLDHLDKEVKGLRDELSDWQQKTRPLQEARP